MIRLTLLYLFVAALMVVAVRRWFVALCGLVLLTVVTQHPSMPTMMFGIHGVNPWNAAFLAVLVAWLATRHKDPGRAPASGPLVLFFGSYVLLVIVSGLVAARDMGSFRGPISETASAKDILIDSILNPLKYVLLGVMFFDGAMTRTRLKLALFTAVGSGLCYSILMFKSLKLAVFTMDFASARRATDKLIGLFANDMAQLLAFSLWAALILCLLLNRNWQRIGWLALVVLAVPAFVALKSRAGFLAFAMIAVVLGALKWRRILLLIPVVLLIVLLFVPSVTERVLTGVDTQGRHQQWDEISSGRTTYIWPNVIAQIGRSPLFGFGRYSILRTDVYDAILSSGAGSVPQHPHNAYLEVLMDAGTMGLLICMACVGGLLTAAVSLLRGGHDRLITAAGAVAICAVITVLSAGVAGGSFYPTQSTVPYLCVWGLTLRLAAERRLRRATEHRAAMSGPAPLRPVSVAGSTARRESAGHA
ncbi:MAG: O-antigen ligase family protein [Phycisphaerae bacterium]